MSALLRLSFPGREPCTACLVLLPAVYARPEEAVDAGFPAALHALLPHASLLLPDLPVDDLRSRTGLVALREEVIAPARRAGLRVWLAGISLGGYLSLLYARRWPEDLAGLLLLAPYLGNPGLRRTIKAAGGPRAWLADTQPIASSVGSEEEREVWRLLAADRLPVCLGFGTDDRFAPGHRLAAELLPPTQVCTVPGGHDWRTWLEIWKLLIPCIDP